MLDGSFAYNGPLKVLLQHIKRQTVPHELMETFLGWGVKFYDGASLTWITLTKLKSDMFQDV